KPQPLVPQTENESASLLGMLQKKWVSWRKRQMVGWYDPIQLLKTARDVFISTIFGRHADSRLTQALTAEEANAFDYRKIGLYLAGDLHHYFHITQNGTDKITAGGGGAFMHPTHGQFGKRFERKLGKLKEAGKVIKRYPETKDSRHLCRGNLLFPFLNPLFGVVTAILYTLAAWSIMSVIRRDGTRVNTLAMAWDKTLRAATETPVAGLWAIAILAGFWLFTDRSSKLYRYFGGPFHGAVHVLMVFLIGWEAYFWVASRNTNRLMSLLPQS